MPRKLRIQYPGARYHVLNRGDPREAIVQDAEEELGRLGWPEAERRGRPQGPSGQVGIARQRRQETPRRLQWLAPGRQMGTWTYGSNRVHPKAQTSSAQEVLPLCQQ